MKIIALLPFRSESWILPTYLSNVCPIVDEIIAIDDQSTDNSREILEKLSTKPIKIYSNTELPKSGWAEFSIRQELLRLGREAGGTHFVCLDADETFTSNFVPIARRIIEKLRPGEKIAMQWSALWKSLDHYRDDQSVWSNNFKDFIVYDIQILGHDYAFLGVGRTPGPNNDATWLKLNPNYGSVLHYQFSHWRNFQLKQCWYRMSELIKAPGTEASINQKYAITLDDPNCFVRAIPEHWLKDIPQPDLENLEISWHIEKIKEWFSEYTPRYFEKLDIWHIPEIKGLIK